MIAPMESAIDKSEYNTSFFICQWRLLKVQKSLIEDFLK